MILNNKTKKKMDVYQKKKKTIEFVVRSGVQ